MDEKLHEVVLKGDVSAFLDLVQEDEDIVKQVVPRSSSTILHLAARLGHHELAAEILKLRPEFAAMMNEKLDTPLHEACREGRAEIVKLLLETDPMIAAGRVNRDNETPLFVGCDRGRLDAVKQLLNHCPWLLALELDGFTTSLHVAASRGHTGKTCCFLLARISLNFLRRDLIYRYSQGERDMRASPPKSIKKNK